MNADLEIALVGLAGVIVGGVITSGVTYATERQKVRREIRRAARLIDVEFLAGEVAVQMSLEEKKWWSKTTPITLDAWEENQGAIASSGLTAEAWHAVTIAVMTAKGMQEVRDGALSIQLAEFAAEPSNADALASAERLNIDTVSPTPAIPDNHAVAPMLEPNLRRMRAGRAALQPLMRDTRWR